MSRNSILLFLILLGMTAGAQAQTSTFQLLPGNIGTNLSVGGWTFNIGACTLKVEGTVQSNCGAEEVIATVAGSTLTLQYAANGGGTLLSTVGCSSCVNGSSGLSDMTLTNESVTAPSGLVNSLKLSLAGTTNVSADKSDITVGSAVTTPSGNPASFTVSLAGPTTATEILTHEARTIVVGNKDMQDNGVGASPGDSMKLTSVTQVFNIPEPATLGLIAMSIGALVVARRRRLRPANGGNLLS